MLYISHTQADSSTAIVFARGPLHNSTSDEFESYISSIVDSGIESVIFDSASVEYISSTGIGALLYVNRKLRSKKGIFILCNVPEDIMSIIRIIKLDKVLTISSSQEDAIEAIRKTSPRTHDDMEEKPLPAEQNSEEPLEELFEVLNGDDLVSDDILVNHTPASGTSTDTAKEAFSPVGGSVDSSSHFTHPIIVECAECKSMLRVSYPGTFLCPDCNSEFTVEEDRTIIF